MATHNGLFDAVDLRSHENNQAHRTEEIDQERLIVRRGQGFSLTLQCSNPLPSQHRLAMVLHLGKRNEVVVKVLDVHGGSDQWWFSQHTAHQSEVLLTVHSPVHAPIGHYSLAVLLMSPDGQILEQTAPESFYLLFNPWCKGDAVHLPEEELLTEYILNETGILYQGSWDHINSMPWNYGQFEDDVMDICFEILDHSPAALKNSEMDVTNRGDPVYVSRTITAMINSNDDRGVLSGRWDGEYSDGMSPSHWTGSVPILRRWHESGAKRVRYGQCWVFAGVACTVLRCLGIPTRCITNYSSAHDTDGNISIDFLYNDRLESVASDGGRKDMIWNFHVWVESWMTREDLPRGYDGWQVLDPTPQERSDGVFCCGPCPVHAVRDGEVGLKYDAPFIFSEVNADVVRWIVRADGRRQQTSLDHNIVGRNISTKSVFGESREDVTHHYKYPEGSAEERAVYEKAGHRLIMPVVNGQNELQLSIRHASAVHGTDFDVIVEVQNTGHQETLADLTVMSKAVTYNSLHRGECQRRKASVTVPAQKAHKEVLRLRYEHYGACVTEHHLIRVIAMLQAKGHDEPILQEVNIPLTMPKLLVQVKGRASVSKKLTAYISFTNPLPVTLRGGVFTVEGAGLTPATEISAPGDIGSGQQVTVKLTFKPSRAGLRKLLVDFDSDRLMDVKGDATIIVRRW
ncbi:protein-glutamine gamma-glutamyltransferase 2-like [Aplochiton taeniatus]